MYIVYETDKWLSNNSKDFGGIFSSKEDAINSIIQNHNICLEDECYDTDEDLIESIREMLEEHNQTQGFDVNYIIESSKVGNWEIGLPTKKIEDGIFLTSYNYKDIISLSFVDEVKSKLDFDEYYHDIACQMLRNNVNYLSNENNTYHLDEIKCPKEIERYKEVIRNNNVIQECIPLSVKNPKLYYLTEDRSLGHYVLSVVITYNKL
jgi:hypothetical protein